MALKAKDVRGLGISLQGNDGTSTGGSATFAGQYCDTTDNGATGTEPLPVLNRWWMWYDGTNDLDVSVDHIVTTWADGPGAMADLKADTGYCRVGALGYANYVVHPSDAHTFVATWEGTTAVASRLVDNTIVSVTVDDCNHRIDELAEAQRLLDIAATRAARSNKLP